MAKILLYLGAALPLIWGISHLVPTKNVIAGFGDISADNRHIISMEWIVEGVSLIFIGFLVALVTYIDSSSTLSFFVYGLTIAALFVLAIVSIFTGFKINFLPFKMCPIVFSESAILITIGKVIQG